MHPRTSLWFQGVVLVHRAKSSIHYLLVLCIQLDPLNI